MFRSLITFISHLYLAVADKADMPYCSYPTCGYFWWTSLHSIFLTSYKLFLTGFDIGAPSEDGSDDAYGLDASAAHIANLLPSEPDAGTVFDVAYITFDSSSSSRSLKIKVESSRDAARRAASSPLPLCHGRGTAGRALGDGVVPYKQGERSEGVLRMSGFRKLTFKAYNGYASVAAATSSSQLVHI
ncbi:hypothetical protein BHM03_00039819, partial [Ensete ventricosum]